MNYQSVSYKKLTDYQSINFTWFTDYQSITITLKKSNEELTSIINDQTNRCDNHHFPMNHRKQCTSTKDNTRTNNKLWRNNSHENEAQGKKARLHEEGKRWTTTYNKEGYNGDFQKLTGVPAILLVTKAIPWF